MNIVTVTSVAGDLNCMNLLQNYVDKVPRDIFIVSFFFHNSDKWEQPKCSSIRDWLYYHTFMPCILSSL